MNGCSHWRVVNAATPVVPARAIRIFGDVIVDVSLDEQSKLVDAKVISAPAPVLADAALEAVKHSTFVTKVTDCRPVASDVSFDVPFMPPKMPVPCAAPRTPARTITAVPPKLSPVLAAERLSGYVLVRVVLDETSAITSVAILSSTNALLNASALDAARQSKFQTEVCEGRPVAESLAFGVHYTAR